MLGCGLQGPHLVAGMLKSGGNAKNSKGPSSAFYVGAWISEYRCKLQGPDLVWWECFSSDDSTARGFKLPNWETGCSTDAVWDWISGESKGFRIYILIVIVFLCLYLYSYLELPSSETGWSTDAIERNVLWNIFVYLCFLGVEGVGARLDAFWSSKGLA